MTFDMRFARLYVFLSIFFGIGLPAKRESERGPNDWKIAGKRF